MGTSRLNIWLRNVNCDLLTSCWRTDLVLQACTGTYLVDTYPEIIDQLKQRYCTSGTITDYSEYPLVDQAGKTIIVTVNSYTAETVTLVAPAITKAQIFQQIVNAFTRCTVALVDDRIVLTTKELGPAATITVSGTNDLDWGPAQVGGGYTILKHYYQSAWRIMLMPPAGQYINHIEVDVPPGCYKAWTRVCHGNNEETSVQMINVRCGEHACVNLLLPTIQTCAAHLLHPLMDKIVFDQFLVDDDQRLVPMRALMYAAKLGKQDVIAQLDWRLAEAIAKGDTILQARVQAVKVLAQLLPECY